MKRSLSLPLLLSLAACHVQPSEPAEEAAAHPTPGPQAEAAAPSPYALLPQPAPHDASSFGLRRDLLWRSVAVPAEESPLDTGPAGI
ncbi:exported hypothetical protein [Cupriavidus oxalaticus]|jgi:hypothetical protein|nr:exported hypothetical protein [Cupriavidus oxalaticus]